MSILIDLTEIVTSRQRGQKPRTKTALFRAAFTLLKYGNKSLRNVASTLSINRRKLKSYYEIFLLSKLTIAEYHYSPLKTGRKGTLSTQDISIMKICAHTLDGVGHPTSKVTLNSLILRLQEGSSSSRRIPLSRASLMRYRRLTQLPKKTVRNGTAVREAKSKEEFIIHYHDQLVQVITKYMIRKELMLNLFLSFLNFYFCINFCLQLQYR
jgi:hypothetical protein